MSAVGSGESTPAGRGTGGPDAQAPRVVAPPPVVVLRPVVAEDLSWLADMITDRDAVGVHNWGGPLDRGHVLLRLTQQLGDPEANRAEVGRLVVEVIERGEGLEREGGEPPARRTPIGSVSWRAMQWGPSVESTCASIGIALLPAWRGRGFGTTAQRRLVEHLFETYPVHRIQADTAVDNPAERKSLERAGFSCEGLIRAAEFRNGRYHDHLLYSLLRREHRPDANGSGPPASEGA